MIENVLIVAGGVFVFSTSTFGIVCLCRTARNTFLYGSFLFLWHAVVFVFTALVFGDYRGGVVYGTVGGAVLASYIVGPPLGLFSGKVPID